MISPGHPSDRESAAHLPKLDGIRAFAILAVMLYHASWLQCGWAGVQAFFVLSGFLITRILVRSKERWQSSTGGAVKFFSTFYWRRALRIVPLYYGFIGLLLVVHLMAGLPANIKGDLPWLLTYTTNIERIFPRYDNIGTHSHLWSLAVEEQFYLVWPAIVWMTPSRLLHRLTWSLIAAGPILRLATGWLADRQWGSDVQSGEVVYNLLTSHLDAFAAGAAVAIGMGFFCRNSLGKLAGCVAITGAIGAWVLLGYLRPIGVAGLNSLGYPHNMPWNYQYVWGYSLLDFTFAFLIAALLQPSLMGRWDPFRCLELTAIAYLGRISYGLYVFHNPIQVMIAKLWHIPAYQPFPIAAFFVSLAATIAVAALSYHLIETWFLKLKDRLPGWMPSFTPTAAAKAAV
jgi:peptidoglycan/LPS O-acetylase OafA/YrhL